MSRTKLNPGKTIELASKGLNNAEIAKIQGVHKSTVGRFLEKHADKLEEAEHFRENQSAFLTALQSNAASLRFDIMQEMEERGVKELTNHELRSLNHSLGVTQAVDFDKSRLLEGKSTQNVQSLVSLAVQEANRRDGINV